MVNISGKWYVAPIEINGTMLLPIFLFVFIFIAIRQFKNKQFKLVKILLIGSLLIYLWMLIDVTIFPIPLFLNGSLPIEKYGKQLFINLRFDVLGTYLPLQLIGNIILLAPLSFFVAMLNDKYAKLWNNLGLMFLSSLLIESTQLTLSFFYLGNRIFDVNDLLLNTLGSMLGFVFFKFCNKIFKPIF
ncbi:VanZ family protein [Lactobacillus sp. ESL0731]|uniref:VanZ family protein n=1 Tax=unclassified Lactobacillus TaxID=2620435 RepID=UPI0023F78EC6|nr:MULTISPECIES: VanZ family protein [unclassified Lactobacillus]WEV51837.1 VanZ family protein [Lactobacillus sp. ESL0700]WEV62967.1 VanZ family protein [Lactobacillus sp. ESL0731]